MGLTEKLVYDLPIKIHLVYSNHISEEEHKAIAALPGSFPLNSRNYDISKVLIISSSNDYATTIRPFMGRDVDVIGIPEDATGDILHDKLNVEFPDIKIIRLPRPSKDLEGYLKLIDQKVTDSLQ